jgi:hypothetical protein
VAATALAAACGGDDGGLPPAQPRDADAATPASSSNQPVATTEAAGAGAQHHDFLAEGVDRIAHVDARFAFDERVATFLDVRDLESYQHAHIPGALSIPLDELPDRIGELDRGQIIITYCT